MRKWRGALAALLGLAGLASVARAQTPEVDPMGSAAWHERTRELFGDARVVFDPRVQVLAPKSAEDALQVPIAVRVDPAIGAERVFVFADYNPIVPVLAFEPRAAAPYLAFRLKMQQSGPVRAAARDADGVWHVGHAWVSTGGGGCTLPALGRSEPEWETRLGEVSARLWTDPVGTTGAARARMRIVHPMDTGLAPGIPAFHLSELRLTAADGVEAMRIEVFEPVAENPVFTVEWAVIPPRRPLRLTGVDTHGNRVHAVIRQ
jgi:sulfur-oxidizing protein SoxY